MSIPQGRWSLGGVATPQPDWTLNLHPETGLVSPRAPTEVDLIASLRCASGVTVKQLTGMRHGLTGLIFRRCHWPDWRTLG